MQSPGPNDSGGKYTVRALRAGASGYLTKDSAAEELLGAIREVLSGGRYISASFEENLAYEPETDADKSIAKPCPKANTK